MTALAAVGCMILAALVLRPFTAYDRLWQAGILALIGAVLTGLALRRSKIATGSLPDFRPAEPMHRAHRVMAVGGVVLMVLLAAINSGLIDSVTTDAQFGLLVAGVVLLILGFGAARFPTSTVDVDWAAVAIVVVLTMAALILRLWQLNQTTRFFVDELSYATAVGNLRTNDRIKLLMPMEGTAAFPYLFPYLESKIVGVLGRNLAGFRAASALLGALTVPAVYALARVLFSRRMAVVAAALLVTFPPHLHFSRLGIIEVSGAFSGVLALAFLMRGLMHSRRSELAAGGALLGLTHYFHEGARVLFTPLAVVSVVLMVVMYRRRGESDTHLLLMAAALLVIVAVPIYTTLASLDFTLTARLNSPNIALDGDYWRTLVASNDYYWHIRWHVVEPFLIFVHQPDRGLFYAGQTPMLLDFLVPVFLIGLSVMVWRWREPGSLVLLVWVMAVIAGNMLLAQSAIMTRYVVVFPAVVIICAVGLCTAVGLVLPRRWQRITIVALVLIFSVGQMQYYFGWHVPLYNVQFRANWGHHDAQDAVLRSIQFPPGTQIHIVSRKLPDRFHTQGLLVFHRDDLSLELLTPEDVNVESLSALPREVDHAFYIDPNEPALLGRLREQFTLEGPTFSPYDLPSRDQFALYYVRKDG